MDKNKGITFFQWLTQLHAENEDIRTAYVSLRRLLEKACRELTSQEAAYFPNLFSRLNFICRNRPLSKSITFRINSFRVRANNVLHDDLLPTENQYLQDLRAICDFFSHAFSCSIPAELDAWMPKHQEAVKKSVGTRKDYIRGEVTRKEASTLYILDADDADGQEWKVQCSVKGVNEAFNDTVEAAWVGCQINLLEVQITPENVLIPKIIVLEPDYLFDITGIAETHKEYGNHPLTYFMDRLMPVMTNVHKLKGTIANQIFDKFISGDSPEKLALHECLKEAYRQSAFDLTTCRELEIPKEASDFYTELKLQHKNIEEAVQKWFQGGQFGLDKEKAVVEPTFLCEKLGLQGRMDFIHGDYSALVELKAGKAAERSGTYLTKPNHYIQLLLYLGVMKYSLGKNPDNIRAYIFYSKYPCLNEETAEMSILKRSINLRNCILAHEYRSLTDEEYARTLLDKIYPDRLNTYQLTSSFWHRYLAPGITAFKEVFDKAQPLELDYFFSFYTFVAREQYLAKLQIHRIEDGREGSYWTDFSAKRESGDILYDLVIAPGGQQVDTTEGTPSVTFQIPAMEREMLPNFRAGDIVLFYERNCTADNATNKQVFKGTVGAIDQDTIHVVLKFRQRNASVIPMESKYAVEHDYMDASGLSMFRALYSFLSANQDRKDLLLQLKTPDKGMVVSDVVSEYAENQDIDNLVQKAKMADGVFLLAGPPGTGKTSIALKAMVEAWLKINDKTRILLLSYTNRAVDEMCETLEKIDSQPEYIRIGNALSCDQAFHHRLMDKKLSGTENREQVRTILRQHRIFTGTVASVNHKQGIFKLLSFDVVMIDEASQILEPSLLGILCAKNQEGKNAIGKIIMIGDTRQLPAVVLQDSHSSVVYKESLHGIGLRDRRESLFERWYRLQKQNASNVAMLQKQGRMHDRIAAFPNKVFYGGQLQVVPTPLQLSELPYKFNQACNPLRDAIQCQRILFIPSNTESLPGFKSSQTGKVHAQEATILARCLMEIEQLCRQSNLHLVASEKSPVGSLSVGIITPYRRQIALIRNELRKAGLSIAETITIDTVERYQGSQRDVILFSFCLNSVDQLEQITSVMMEEDVIIDRKFNVALTRAKQQLIVTGNPGIMKQNGVFSDWLDFVEEEKAVFDLDKIDL